MALSVLDVVPEPVSSQEQDLIDLLTGSACQERTTFTANEILMRVAQRRATDMATRNYFGHTDPDGWGPNHHVREAGYDLHSSYGTGATDNNIESITAGTTVNTAQEAWDFWMASAPHKEHLCAEIEFYQLQDEYGVGYAFNSGATYDHYWVILTARQN